MCEAEFIDDVDGDPVKPVAQRGCRLEIIQVKPSPQEGFLGGLLRQVDVGTHAVDDMHDALLILEDQLPEGAPVTQTAFFDQARFDRSGNDASTDLSLPFILSIL